MEEFKSPPSASLSDVVDLRHRQSVPDVPEDIEDNLKHHFNDPNWDFHPNSSKISVSTDGVEEHTSTRWSRSSARMGAGTEADTESQSSAWPMQDSKLDFSSETTQVQDSPYPEVRAAVPNTDDPAIPVNTFRVWFIGLTLSMILPAANTVLTMRLPYVMISALFVQIITLPIGKFLEWALPKRRVSAFGHSFSLNPGPFNVKEHVLISIMANVVVDGVSITDIAFAMRLLHGVHWSFGKTFFLGIAPQFLGFSVAGVIRQFLVWPSSMIWPGVLVRCALLNTMHSNHGKKETKHISRERFLYITGICSFVWYWVPGYLWTGLSVFNWVCWISPNNVVVNSLFGTISGLGMGLVTFDWTQISFLGSPLVVPWWAQLNMLAGFVSVIWFLCPILWAKNVFYSQFMPISVGSAFDNTGNMYNLSAILTNNQFDQAKYEQYSPMFLPITYAVTYGTFFAAYPAIVVHTFLWYRRDIVHQFRRSLRDETDIHAHLMRKYPEAPRWWFIALGLVAFFIGVIAIEISHIGLPVWAYSFAFIFALIFIVPFGIVQATTNQVFYLSVLAELLFGYILPGRPIATMFFRSIASDTVFQALIYASDLKFGHYMKIPQRLIFVAQVVASLISLVAAIAAQRWALDNIPDICSPDQKDFFTCPNLRVFSTSATIWGSIGPRRLFSPGALYYPLVWFFLIGAVLPIPFYYLAHRRPRSFWRYVHMPIILIASVSVPPGNGVNLSSWILTGLVFQWFMRRYHFRWWMRYNYLLSSGLEAGAVTGIIVVFFAVQYPHGGFTVNWWGNKVWQNTADAKLIPLKTLAPGETFGPATWS